jgi:hypothetical protein
MQRQHLAARSLDDVAQDTDKPPILLGDQRWVVERLLNRAEARHPQRIPAGEEALDRGPVNRLRLANAHTATVSQRAAAAVLATSPSGQPPALDTDEHVGAD